MNKGQPLPAYMSGRGCFVFYASVFRINKNIFLRITDFLYGDLHFYFIRHTHLKGHDVGPDNMNNTIQG